MNMNRRTVSFMLLVTLVHRAAAEPRSFVVYDNMAYRGKPDVARAGLMPCNIVYEGWIWPHDQNFGVLPERAAFEAIMRQHVTKPGPVVLDIERLPLKGSPDTVHQHALVLATLADWTRASFPGRLVGYYGGDTLTRVPAANAAEARELARHVEAMYPPMYTFDDDRGGWAARAEAEAAEARALAPGKPVLFYLWPQFHDGTPKQFQYVDGATRRFQLDTARRFADGVVLWSPGRFEWNDSSGWWAATQSFIRANHLAGALHAP